MHPCATALASLSLLSQNAVKGWGHSSAFLCGFSALLPPRAVPLAPRDGFSPGRGNLRTLTPTARCPPLPFSPASPPQVVSLGDETNPAQPSVSAKTALCPACPRVPSSLLLAGDPQELAQPRGPLLPQGHPAPRGQVGGPASPRGGNGCPQGRLGTRGGQGWDLSLNVISPSAHPSPAAGGSALRRDRAGP